MSRFKKIAIAIIAAVGAAIGVVVTLLRMRRVSKGDSLLEQDLADREVDRVEKETEADEAETKRAIAARAAVREQAAREAARFAGADDGGDPRGVLDRHGFSLSAGRARDGDAED